MKPMRALVRRAPRGVVGAPFETMVAISWGITGGRLLADALLGSHFDPGSRRLLPFTDRELAAWSSALLLGCLLVFCGLVATVRFPVAGLYVERLGLIFLAATTGVLAWNFWQHGVPVFSIAMLGIVLTFATILLRFFIVGVSLDVLREASMRER